MEICLENTWGTVCYDFWERVDAEVVCRQLGYTPQGQGFFFLECSFGGIAFVGREKM